MGCGCNKNKRTTIAPTVIDRSKTTNNNVNLRAQKLNKNLNNLRNNGRIK